MRLDGMMEDASQCLVFLALPVICLNHLNHERTRNSLSNVMRAVPLLEVTLNKQQLAAKIWASANKMRPKIESNEYKDFILGFIFYKFLSETEVSKLKDMGLPEEELPSVTEDNEEVVNYLKEDACGYFIAYDNLFQTWIKKGNDFNIADVRDALNAFSRNIAPAYQKVFYKIFDNLLSNLSHLGTDANDQSGAARDLIHLLQSIPMDSSQDYDVLGFIYEYLIGKFAASAGKKAGEFYTPHEVSVLMSEIVAGSLGKRDTVQIYDPTSGSGSLLINIGKAMARRGMDQDAIKYYAQEIKEATYNLTRMNLVMRGIRPSNIEARNGDTLEDDWPFFESDDTKFETYQWLPVDAVVSNPPYSQKWDPKGKELDPRFREYGLAPSSKADYAFLLHDLYHLKSDGIQTIVLPHGVLFRGGEEAEIRKKLVKENNIQAIIGLPPNIFYGTGIPTVIMVIRKDRTDSGIFFVDASKHYIKEGSSNKLRASDIKRIVDAVTSEKDIPKFSRKVSLDEIIANGYNLNILRYVDSSPDPETWDLHAIMFGGVPKSEVDMLQEYWNAWPKLRAELFRKENGPYYIETAADVEASVRGNEEVMAFQNNYSTAISGLPSLMATELVEDPTSVNPITLENQIADALELMIAQTPLIDPYDAYQLLDEDWIQISNDIEVIKNDGIDAVRSLEPNMVIKKRKGKDVEVQDGWIGRILPFDLVQREFLPDQLNAIAELEANEQDIQSQLSDLLEGIDQEDKDNTKSINKEGDAFVTAELKKEAKKIDKSTATDFEQTLLRAYGLTEQSGKNKKQLKKMRTKIDEDTQKIITDLDDDHVKAMLVAKWINPLQNRLESLSDDAIETFIYKVKALCVKYSNTYSDVCEEIEETERSLSSMLGDLTGDEYDMAALDEFKKLLGGK